MENEYILEKFDNSMHYIMLDKKTVEDFTTNGNKRVLCVLNNQVEIHSAIMPKKDGGHYINIGLAICKKLKIKEGSKITANVSVDNSEYQFEMPEELKEVLETDTEAGKRFHSLTAGNQRSLIYLVTQVKRTDKRIERALKIAEKIKQGVTSAPKILKSSQRNGLAGFL